MYTPSLYMHAGSCPCPDNKKRRSLTQCVRRDMITRYKRLHNCQVLLSVR
jgi:hypothetical protein